MSGEPAADVAPRQFVVIISDGRGHVPAVLGPFTDREEAERFAAFATVEIDPAEVRTLMSPLAELLNWRDLMLKGCSDEHPF